MLDTIVFLFLILLFYVPTIFFVKYTSKENFEVAKGKYYNLDFIILAILLLVNILFSILELLEIVTSNNIFYQTILIFESIILLVSLIRRFYYTLLERYNLIRVFIYPFIILIIFTYHLLYFFVSLNLSNIIFSNLPFFDSTYSLVSIFYFICSFVYLLSAILIPIYCYKKRNGLLLKVQK